MAERDPTDAADESAGSSARDASGARSEETQTGDARAEDRELAALLDHLLVSLDRLDLGGLRGVYLYGSAMAGGLRPGSDVDLLLLTDRALGEDERTELTDLLLPLSGWSEHAEQFPEAASRRPLEVTSLAIGDIEASPARPRVDYQYGEWLRAEIAAGALPQPTDDPDATILLATALRAHRALRGPALGDLVGPVSADDLRTSMLAVIPDILEEIEGDERNTLLALCRILVTLRTGEIVPKDHAASYVAAALPPSGRDLVERAREGYLSGEPDTWDGRAGHVTALARSLAARARDEAKQKA